MESWNKVNSSHQYIKIIGFDADTEFLKHIRIKFQNRLTEN